MVYQMKRRTYTLALMVLGMLQGSTAFTTQRNAFAADRSVHALRHQATRLTSTRSVSQASTYSIPTEEFQTHFPQPTLADSISETHGAFSRVSRGLSSVVRFDKEKFAKVGVSFALTYSIISNINGSVSLSVAWYMASMHTGLSPLAPGNWKSLLAAYGGLYVFLTLMRPLRVGLAMALTSKTDAFLENVQARLGCSRAAAVGVQFSLGILLWIGCIAGGLSAASTLSGVPIFH